MRMRTRKSAGQWGELVSAWEASGLTADVFASERGVAGATLRWWKMELASERVRSLRDGRRSGRHRRRATSRSRASSALVERGGCRREGAAAWPSSPAARGSPWSAASTSGSCARSFARSRMHDDPDRCADLPRPGDTSARASTMLGWTRCSSRCPCRGRAPWCCTRLAPERRRRHLDEDHAVLERRRRRASREAYDGPVAGGAEPVGDDMPRDDERVTRRDREAVTDREPMFVGRGPFRLGTCGGPVTLCAAR